MGEAPHHPDAPRDHDASSESSDREREPSRDGGLDDSSSDRSDGAEPVPFELGDGDIATRIAHAKQRHGRAGGMLAAGMLGIDQVVNGRKPREEAPVVVAANSDPIDIDLDGISVPLDDDLAVAAPPLPRRAPIVSARGTRRRGR